MPSLRFAGSVCLALLLSPLGHGQTLQELLAARPVFPQIPWVQELDESPAQRHARISAWETLHSAWLQDMAAFQQLDPVIRGNMPPPAKPGQAPQAPPALRLTDFTDAGDPVYSGTDNAEAAVSTHARTLRDGLAGLDGANEIAAVWDSGAIRQDHREFQGTDNQSRVNRRNSVLDDSHATHVGGTIAASGVDPSAKGMAPAAILDSWDTANVLSELTAPDPADAKRFNNVANDAMDFPRPSVSNHSYSERVTWSWSSEEGRWFWLGTLDADLHAQRGVYSRFAREQDSTAAAMPSHLIIRSAGNNRNNGPGEGDTFAYRANTRTGWDTAVYDPSIHPPRNDDVNAGYVSIGNQPLAKNVLTVGNYTPAQNVSPLRDPRRAEPNESSSWGPTLCGRVKPDLVANGTDVFSTNSRGTAAYIEYSGTSMSTPAVTGTALLLQQFHRSLGPDSRRLDADELKGLLIHTCDDIETPGPDYRSGFGLLNAAAAKHVMSRARGGNPAFLGLTGTVSTDGGAGSSASHSVSLENSAPVALKATLVWMDPPADVQDFKNHGSTLVNDLDLRIIDEKGVVRLPFVLDPQDPSGAAYPDDNILDNVEQVLFPAAPDGVYTIQVSCKPNGNPGSQRYALWVSPVTDALATEQLSLALSASGAPVPLAIRSDATHTLIPAESWIVPQIPTAEGDRTAQVGALWNTSGLSRESTVLLRAAGEGGEIEVRVQQAGSVATSSIPLPEGLGEPTLAFATSPGAAWEGIRSFLGLPGDVALSASIGDGQATWVRHEFTGPGAVSFDYQVSSEAEADFLSFNSIVGGVANTHLWRSGSVGWTSFSLTFDVGGVRTLEWIYEKDGSGSAGNDRALLRNLKIHRLLPSSASLASGHAGDPVPFSWTMTHPNPWQIRNASPWLFPANLGGNGGGSSPIAATRNFSVSPRVGTFEIGSAFLGFQNIAVTQAASPRIAIADVVAASGLMPSTADDGVGWIAVSGAGKDGQDAIGVSGHPAGPSAALGFTRTGPGVLYFQARLDHAGEDLASLEINGQFFSLAAFGEAGDAWRACAVYLPDAENALIFRHTHGGDPGSPNGTALSGFSFLPGTFVQDPPLVPATGGGATFSINGFGPGPWDLFPVSSDESPLLISSTNGSGEGHVLLTLGPDSLRQGAAKFLDVSLDGRPSVRIPILQQKPFVLAASTGLDLPLGVTAAVVSPTPSRVIGHTAFSADGLDAAVMGHHIGAEETIVLSFAGPALLTLDYAHVAGQQASTGFRFLLNDSPIAESGAADGYWRNLVVHQDAPGPHELRVEKITPAARYLHLDRVRMESLTASWDGQTRVVDAGAGAIYLPYETGSASPLATSDPAFLDADLVTDSRTGRRHLRVAHTSLPPGPGGRGGWVDLAGQRLHILQIRESVMDTGYLTMAGVSDTDGIRHQPGLQPFAPQTDGSVLAYRHAFALDFPAVAALPELRFANGHWLVDVATRNGNLLTRPSVELSTDLQAWHPSWLENGEWTQVTGFSIERRADGNSSNLFYQTHGLFIQATDPAIRRAFIRQGATFAE